MQDRKSTRLQGYDYSQNGAYFVTICTHQKVCLFGDVSDDKMVLNRYGEIATAEWHNTARLRSNVELDAFVIMPNHTHAIIVILDDEQHNSVRGRGLMHFRD